jgi:methylenetetrahydrofolate reductase (NADPH)
MKNDKSNTWTLEIVPSHAEKVPLFEGLVKEIYITMIPGNPIDACLEAARKVKEQGFMPVPHVAARNFPSEAALNAFFEGIQALGLPKILLLAGGHGAPEGPYHSSFDILETEAFRKAGLETVALAGHPEGNPEDARSWENLLEKCSRLDDLGIRVEIVTQWSFSPEKVDAYLEALHKAGITIPVRVGVPGPANLKTLIKYAKICGVSASATAIRKQGLNMGKMLLSNKPDRFVSEVSNTSHFHIYPFGGLEKCAAWLKSRQAGSGKRSAA